MLLPATYAIPANGAVGGSGAAYYWYGSDGANNRKFRTGPAIVEAGWLSGFMPTSRPPLGSNLPIRDVARYWRVTSSARFSTIPLISQTFVGKLGKSNAAFPGTTAATGNNWIWD